MMSLQNLVAKRGPMLNDTATDELAPIRGLFRV